MEIVIHDSVEDMARMAAGIFEDVLKTKENPVLGLATGSSPLPIYAELVRRHKEEGLSFAHAKSFTLDEYVGLPEGHPESYQQVIRNELTTLIDIPDTHVYSPDGGLDDILTAGERYEAAITAAGGIDVQLLGIGTDGHIAFNEPGSSLQSRTRVKTLTEQTRLDNARFFNGLEEVPYHAITQGLGTILDAKHLVLIAIGKSKAEAVVSMVEGGLAASCPASVLQMHPRATVFLDREAASFLKNYEYYNLVFERKPKWQTF